MLFVSNDSDPAQRNNRIQVRTFEIPDPDPALRINRIRIRPIGTTEFGSDPSEQPDPGPIHRNNRIRVSTFWNCRIRVRLNGTTGSGSDPKELPDPGSKKLNPDRQLWWPRGCCRCSWGNPSLCCPPPSLSSSRSIHSLASATIGSDIWCIN